jgi:hypothetical protein
MSWTSYKRRLRPGAQLYIHNLRRPWRSRNVEIVHRSKRSILLKDTETGDLANLHLPLARFTRMVNDNDVEFLADEDGPRFLEPAVQLDDIIMAGMPWMIMRVKKDA